MGIRRLFVCLLAAAFIFGGSAVHATLMLPEVAQDQYAPAAAVPDAQQKDAAHHSHGGDHAIAAVDGLDHAQPQQTDHGQDCLKCCNMCGAATMSADDRGAPVTFVYGTVRFRIGQRDIVGHLVALDPDIPKVIV